MKFALVFLLMFIVACSEPATEDMREAAPDAAQLSAPEPKAGTPVEELRIGSADDPTMALSGFRLLAVSRNGHIYIPQDDVGEIRRYDHQGRFLGAFGGTGDGPGEFQSFYSMGWVGDTLWVHDGAQRRISFFSADGLYLHSRLFVPKGIETPFVPGTVLSVSRSGQVTAQLGVFSQAVMEGLIEAAPVIAADSLGTVADTLAILPISRGDHGIRMPNRWMFFQRQPWGDDPLWASAPDGSGFYRVDRHAPGNGDRTWFTVTRLDPSGSGVFELAVPYGPLPLRSHLVDLYVDRVTESLMSGESPGFNSKRQARDATRESLYVPDYLPPVSAVVAGRDNSAWLRRENTLADSAVWTIVNPRGNVAQSLVLPAGATVLQADQTHAWVRSLDEVDIPYLIRYRIEPSS